MWAHAWVQRRAVHGARLPRCGGILRISSKRRLQCSERLSLCHDIMKLCAIADKEHVGHQEPHSTAEMGLKWTRSSCITLQAYSIAISREVCARTHYSRLRLLPGMHTPQNGLTIRSLSLYVCLCAPSEVVPAWIEAMSPLGEDSLKPPRTVPWPMERNAQFFASRNHCQPRDERYA